MLAGSLTKNLNWYNVIPLAPLTVRTREIVAPSKANAGTGFNEYGSLA